MKRHITCIGFVLAVAFSISAFGQQDNDYTVIQGYQHISATKGVLSSPTIRFSYTGGIIEKLENNKFVFQLNPNASLNCSFKLPEKAYDVKAVVRYNVPDAGVKGNVYMNGVLLCGANNDSVLLKGDKVGIAEKEIPLNEFQQDNTLKISSLEGALQIVSVTVLYKYRMPSCSVGDVKITLLSPNPDFDDLTSDLVLKWKGSGPCDNGWITIKYKDGYEWKTVPGAAAFDLQDEEWNDQFNGQYIWKNCGLKSFPELRIEYTEGENPVRPKAQQLAEEAKQLYNDNNFSGALAKIDEALNLYPNNADFQQIKYHVRLKINPFMSEGRKAGDRIVVTVNNVDFAFIWCPADAYMMGASKSDFGRMDNEKQHEVTLTHGFWIMETEVTQLQYYAIMGINPSRFQGENLPVERVSWDDCQKFCQKCAELGLPMLLPTEAQWEYSCRAGSTDAYAGDIEKMAWFDDNSENKTHPVKTMMPNAWGIYDMHGNVLEWTADWYKDYSRGKVKDPTGPSKGSEKVCRGGSWYRIVRNCRSAYREYKRPDFKDDYLGFRCVVNPK